MSASVRVNLMISAAAVLVFAGAVAASAQSNRAKALRPSSVEASPVAVMEAVPYKIPATRPRSAARTVEPMFDLPFWADDLEPGERWDVGKTIHSSSGSQMWGYDVGVMRRAGDRWTSLKAGVSGHDQNPKNSNYLVYGKPIYAMGAGTIIRCWRNAPDNPRAFSSALGDDWDEAFEDRDWLHTAWRQKKMSGAGNHLLVEEDDGDLVLYAHAQPGTIPSRLCPHNAQLYSQPEADSEGDVPEAQRVRVHAGELLYKAGNSGNSSAPHLHVHKQTADGEPIQMRFRRGLSTPRNGDQADINAWTRFAGQRIPDGPVLIWPPRRLGAEYARHGFPAADYQRMFDHLADSGFQPTWLDVYSVGGNSFFNMVWRPAEGEWRAHHLVSAAAHQSAFDKASQDGFAPVLVESSLSGGQARYTAVFVKNKPGGALARHGLTTAQHDAVIDEAKALGLSPVSVSVVSVGGQRRYTVLYRSEGVGKWEMKSQVPEAQYQALYDANAQAGRRPIYLNAYMHQGQPFLSALFAEKPGGPRKDRHSMSAAQYQAEYESALQSGLFTRAVTSFDGAAAQHRYAATWRKE